jgi:hypothetical protein
MGNTRHGFALPWFVNASRNIFGHVTRLPTYLTNPDEPGRERMCYSAKRLLDTARGNLDLKGREQVDRVPIRILYLRVALSPNRVPWRFDARATGLDHLAINAIDLRGGVT